MSIELDDLIRRVEQAAGTDEPIDRLHAAAGVRDELADLADSVLDHFVQGAREAGCSWSQIGGALGVSKQAVQQRHGLLGGLGWLGVERGRWRGRRARGGTGPFKRFTDRARQSVVEAQQEARLLCHNYIGTEHLLLGLLRVEDGVAAKVLGELSVTTERVRGELDEIIGRGSGAPAGHVPFTPRSKKVLELSLRESLAMSHNYIGTEHILLALLAEGEGVAAQILERTGVRADDVRKRVIDELTGR